MDSKLETVNATSWELGKGFKLADKGEPVIVMVLDKPLRLTGRLRREYVL